MDVLEQSLLILPNLDQVIAITVELSELLWINLEDHYYIVIGAIMTILTGLVLRWHSNTISALFVVKNLNYL